MKKVKKLITATLISTFAFGSLSVFAESELDLIFDGKNGTVAQSNESDSSKETDTTIQNKGSIGKTGESEAKETDTIITGNKTIGTSNEGTAAETDTVITGNKTVGTSTKEEEKAAPAKTYPNLAYTEKNLYSVGGYHVGVYPSITNADKLNERIEMDLLKILQGEFTPENYPNYQAITGGTSIVETGKAQDFTVSYKAPENFDRYAKVAINVLYRNSVAKIEAEPITLEYYVDKDGFVEITKASFDKALADIEAAKKAAEEAAAEAEKEETATEKEVFLVPVRTVAEALGFEVGWDGDLLAVTLTSEDFNISFQIDNNVYTVDDIEVELDTAPTLVDSITYVPSSLFDLLGFDLVVDEEGNISLAE